jgi:hypothetical protein
MADAGTVLSTLSTTDFRDAVYSPKYFSAIWMPSSYIF